MENLNCRRSQMQASFCMGFVFICFGLPLWWKTTEVYRADLPYTEIQHLADKPELQTKVSVKIVSSSEQLAKKAIAALTENLHSDNLKFITVEYKFEQVTISKDEVKKLKSGNNVNSEPGNDSAVLLVINPSDNVKNPEIFVTRKRMIFLEIPSYDAVAELEKLTDQLAKFFSDRIVNAGSVNDAISKAYGASLDISKDREFHLRKTVQPDKGYDLLFSLLCPEPEKLQVSWDIESATSMYLRPMLVKLGGFADFRIGSQILYYSGLSVTPKKIKKGKGKRSHYYLTHQQLSHVVNPIESRLGAQMSSNPTLNFVIYNTEEKYNPLQIKHADDSYSATNTFLIPRWGSIMIKNVVRNATVMPQMSKLNSMEFMEIFIAQLRSLLGIEAQPILEELSVVYEAPDLGGITVLELDYLFRARTAENIATATHTLHSLAQLLEKIQNIVINDKIADHVYTAVREIRGAKKALENGDLAEALRHSNVAFRSAEIAFFDPTLLELLYFPEDQKFAIYIPLFLPISLPLVSSLLNAMKLYKAEKAKQKLE